MPDVPRQQQPFSNMTPVPNYTDNKGLPKGPKAANVNQAKLAVQGLIGAK